MTDYIVPLLLFFLCAFALGKKEDPYSLMVQGAGEGVKLILSILPTLVVLLTSVIMLRESGAMDALGRMLGPAFGFLGIPPETAILILVRPISGSAALAVGTELMMAHGPDSLIGRTAAVMLGSTETTFYTVSVYFGAAGVHKSRYAIPAALLADGVGFLMASLTVRVFYT